MVVHEKNISRQIYLAQGEADKGHLFNSQAGFEARYDPPLANPRVLPEKVPLGKSHFLPLEVPLGMQLIGAEQHTVKCQT